MDSLSNTGPSRRNLIAAAAGIASAPAVGHAAGAESPQKEAPAGQIEVVLDVNGQTRRGVMDVRTSLLDALRDHLDLTGSKKGCDQGQCGACTVLLDGERVLGCLTLAIAVEGRRITTVEGLADASGSLHPMQQAFIDQDGFQCGYCTPGQILSAIACVHEGHVATDDEIREYMSGNLCRCAAYPKIVAAINQAKGRMPSIARGGQA